MKRGFEFILEVNEDGTVLVETDELMFKMLCKEYNDDFEFLIKNWDDIAVNKLEVGKYKVTADGGLTKSGNPVIYVIKIEKLEEGNNG